MRFHWIFQFLRKFLCHFLTVKDLQNVPGGKKKQNTLGGLFSQLFHKLSAGGLEEAQGIQRQTKLRWGGSGESGKKVEKLLS